MHEAGHAAHFANIVQPSPMFSQERAPTSVAYAENQSMFLDSLVADAAWRGRCGGGGPFGTTSSITYPLKLFQYCLDGSYLGPNDA
jgi:hypothetical protein